MEDHPTEDNPGAPHGLPHDPQPAGAPGKHVEDVDKTPPTHSSNGDAKTAKCPPDSPSMRYMTLTADI